jgi:hypothetical protein
LGAARPRLRGDREFSVRALPKETYIATRL